MSKTKRYAVLYGSVKFLTRSAALKDAKKAAATNALYGPGGYYVLEAKTHVTAKSAPTPKPKVTVKEL